MAEAINLATAYVTLVPSMQGAQGTIMEQLVPGASGAGAAAGKQAGGAFGGAWKKYLGAAALVGGTVMAFKGLYEVGETFKEVTDTIRVGTGASGEALDDLVQSAKNVGKNVPAEFENVGSVLADVNTRFGLTGDVLETVSSQYLEAGRILGAEVDIGKTSAAFSAFKIEGEGVVGAMDTLFQVSQATGVGMNELAAGVQSNAPAMQSLGFSFEETTSLIGSLDKAGFNSSKMMGGMSRAMVELAKDGEAPAEAFERTIGELDSLIASGDEAASIQLAEGIFGVKNASQFLGAVQDGTLALDDLVGATGKTDDTILGVGKETQNFAEKWQLVKNNALAALEPLGSKIFDAVGKAMEKVIPLVETFGAWLGDNEWALGVFATLIGVVLVSAFWALTAPIWAVTGALLASPITWIVLGIVALIAGLVLLIQNWDSVVVFLKDVWGGVVDWLAGVWDSILGGITTAWNFIVGFYAGIWDTITGALTAAWDGIVGFFAQIPGRILDFFMKWTLAGWLISNWDGIKTTAQEKWNGLINWVKGIPGRFLGGLKGIANIAGNMAGWVGGMKDRAVSKFLELVDWVKGMPKRILSGLGNVGTLLTDAGKNIISGFLKGLTAGFDKVKDFVGGIGSWISNNKGPKAYDLALLVPAGGWIMDGLGDGIEGGIPSLRATLDRVTDEIQIGADISARSGAASNSYGSAPVAAASSGMNIGTLNTGADPAEIFDELGWRERVAAL